jgi:hypothetical protein
LTYDSERLTLYPRVGATLTQQEDDQADRIARVVRECVANLPAETL